MRKILLATTLLSIVVSENILMENHPRLKAWICDKQLWNRKTKRIPRKDISSKMEESLNYGDNRQFSRISDTRFIGESRKLPSTIIRRHEFSQDDFSFDKSKSASVKPRVTISIGIQEDKNIGNDLQKDCSKRKNYCKHNQGWQLQQPIYVEEPTWVDIDIDYIDSPHRVDNVDPYILTRGKKIYRIKNPEQVVKTIEDYEATLSYPSKKLSIKNRMKRTAETNEESQNKTADIKERNYSLQDINNTAIIGIENKDEESYKISKEAEKPKDTSYAFVEKYEKDDLNNLTKRLLHRFKFINQKQMFANSAITDFIQQKIPREDIPRDIESKKTVKIGQIERIDNGKSHFAININNRNKKSVLLKNQDLFEIRKKRDLYEIHTNSEKDKKNETYEHMKTKAYVNKLNDRYTPDNFILSRDKNSFHDGIENLEKDTGIKSIEKAWKLRYEHRKKLEEIDGAARNTEDRHRFDINKDIDVTDSRLTNEPNSKNSVTKSSNYREKRTVCKACKIEPHLQDEWLKNIEKEIQESLSLERRDKHILERLSEPYIISRGKKVPRDFERDALTSMSNSRNMNDEDRAEMTGLPVESLLRALLMKTSRCDNDINCDINANRLSDERLTSPRDRRGSLDEIFAVYDPYYVARGKRNQPDVPFETDARQ